MGYIKLPKIRDKERILSKRKTDDFIRIGRTGALKSIDRGTEQIHP